MKKKIVVLVKPMGKGKMDGTGPRARAGMCPIAKKPAKK